MVARPKHMDENQLMPEDTSCRFCGSNKRVPITVLQEKPQVWLLECSNCQAASASRIPKDKALEDYYQTYYSSNCDEKITFGGTDRFANHLYSDTIKYLRKPHLKILDFGGGDGSISVKTSYKLLTAGIEWIDITLVDYNEILTKIDNQYISLTHRKSLDDLPSGNYDLVLASAIIEHLPQPKQTLIRLLKLLNDGGVFFARTPYVVPLIKLYRILGRKWDFMYPMHLHDLGSEFWNTFLWKMSLDEHFKVIKSKPSIVEASLKSRFIRAIASYTLKAPWYLIGSRYKLVGGWEIFIRKQATLS